MKYFKDIFLEFNSRYLLNEENNTQKRKLLELINFRSNDGLTLNALSSALTSL